MSVPTSLPPLTPDQAAHSACLVDRIRDEIDAHQGWISFERFMELALYEPGLGYYSAGASKFGEPGDFVTAPEISPLFSRFLANQCIDVFEQIGTADILELGAGSGVMASDILTELQATNHLPRTYFILEVSADLRERQRERIARLAPDVIERVQWLDAWPTNFRGIVLANEVLDALPVHRFRIRKDQVNAVGPRCAQKKRSRTRCARSRKSSKRRFLMGMARRSIFDCAIGLRVSRAQSTKA